MTQGRFILSLDYELIWGVYEKKRIWDYVHSNLNNANDALVKICDLAEQYDIKLSIGIVGLLNIDHNKNDDSICNNKIKSIAFWKKNRESIYRNHLTDFDKICGDPSIIQNLISRKNIEIVSHTYYHSFFQDEENLKETLSLESFKIKELFKLLEIPMNSIIFPRNQYNKELLKEFQTLGFRYFRGIDFGFSWTKHSLFKKNFNLLSKLYYIIRLYSGYPVDRTYFLPKKEMGLKNVKGSYFMRPYNHITKKIEHRKVLSIKKQMSKAALEGKYFHIWWHPHNYGKNLNENLSQIEEIFRHYKELNLKFGYESKFISES